jgi:hypothetical protein
VRKILIVNDEICAVFGGVFAQIAHLREDIAPDGVDSRVFRR